jgi:hypothetical protein
MSIAEKLDTVGKNQQKVYDAGKKAQRQAFWDALQDNGNRTDYSYAFYMSTWASAFKDCPPVHDMKPTTATYMFDRWNDSAYTKTIDLVELLESCGVTLDFSNCTSFNRTFESNVAIHHIGVMDIRKGTNFTSTFSYSKIDTIDKLIVDETLSISPMFTYYSELQNIEIEGVIGKSLSLATCSKLTHDSLQSIIIHLKDLTDLTTQTLTLHATVFNNVLTEEQKAEISRRKWTLAY